jgi:hypothetical protein
MIGWYGVPGKTPRDPKVHVVRNGQTVCGTLFSRYAEFQECAAENERTLQMVECERCRRILNIPNAHADREPASGDTVGRDVGEDSP